VRSAQRGHQTFLGSVTGQLTGPIFRFNQNKRRVEAERAKAKQVGYQYEKTVLTAFAEVENTLAEVRTYRNEFGARQTQVAAPEDPCCFHGHFTMMDILLSCRYWMLSANYSIRNTVSHLLFKIS